MRFERTEGGVQLLILITVAGMAGAASFTHVHDWTMRNVPSGTGSWLGWANAVITELVPAAAGIEIRRRKRQHRPVTYPLTILVADAVVSIAVQLSDALHTLAGGVAFVLPALAFLALTKLVLSRSRTPSRQEEIKCAQPAPASDASPFPAEPKMTAPAITTPPIPVTRRHSPAPSVAPVLTAEDSSTSPTSVPATATGTTSPTRQTQGDSSSSPGAPAQTVSPSSSHLTVLSPQLLASARMTAFAHQQATGQPITAAVIAARLGVPPDMAESLLTHLDGTFLPVTKINGTVLDGSRP